MFGVSELSVAFAATSLVPAPALVCVDCVPYEVLVPYSKYHVVAVPFGLTVPETAAEFEPVAVTGPVTAVGFVAAAALAAAIAKIARTKNPVANSLPNLMPPEYPFR